MSSSGAFSGRKFNIKSSLHPTNEPKKFEMRPEVENLLNQRIARINQDRNSSKAEASDTQSVNSIGSSSSKRGTGHCQATGIFASRDINRMSSLHPTVTPKESAVKSESSPTELASGDCQPTRKVLGVLAEYPQRLMCDETIEHISDSRESIDSSATNSQFSLAPESPDRNHRSESPQSLLKQIESLALVNDGNEERVKKIQSLVVQLNKNIITSDQSYRNRIKEMEKYRDTSFAELMIERNDELRALRDEVEDLKAKLEEASRPKEDKELLAAKNEAQRLQNLLKRRNDEIRQLTYELIDAKTNIHFMEKEKFLNVPLPQCVDTVREHINVIKQALLSDRSMLQMLESRKYSSDQNNLTD